MEPLIEIESVDTVYEGEKIATLKAVSLKIWPGDMVCVLGSNGVSRSGETFDYR